MRAVFVFVLLTLLVCSNGIASAKSSAMVSALHSEAVEAPVSSDATRRRLRGTVVVDEERVLGLEKLANSVASIFKRKPGLIQKVEKLQSSPSAVKALEKATLSGKSSNKLRAYFARLAANSNKAQQFFILATIVLFAAGVTVTWLT
ncbi:Avr1b-1 avirulence-like protein [Phytophthora sojae]|uniref:Avr1b-1 avirulence-like protein n=2 Tax=Phytophthora sojae TaxID=67593 RepID=G5A9K1_PHYSP|nr:Avr1b-1 avirulence-like protein [Phytophthora sojae]AEK80717.1 Avh131 [Phytophthora sojae]AEK80718.1 Avh131 [Phytophthora sojae]AEK80719.1 Avh131 [Phytophthora sojae]EGZ07281.1 Avr1b-1 avirulence-like protein [Phytophthora sojae]|eukprot:XP_009536847.1 Avr1b-1 avirulence-like protein [Phytophthora sojae]